MSHDYLLRPLATAFAIAGLALSSLAPQTAVAQEERIIELRNGMRLGPGIVIATDSITTSSFQQGGAGEGKSEAIGIMDDGLRRTYFNNSARNVLQVQKANVTRLEQIELASAAETAKNGQPPSILGILGISEFNRFGRRTYSFMTSRGQVDVLQGITLLTPQFAKVEVLRTNDKFVWDSRIALSSIPAQQLREILRQALDLKKSSEWLRLTSFYLQAERYAEARETIAEALSLFPTELADRTAVLAQTEQLLANQMFEELKLRQNAGQHKLAAQLLGSFPAKALPIETQVLLSEQVDTLKQQVLQVAQLTDALQASVAQLPEADQLLIGDVIAEIAAEINLDNAVRLADFQRLRADDSLATENLVALAIGGWLLGPSSGVQNFAVAKSLVRVQTKVYEYLNESSAPRREQILNELRSEEGAQPALLAKLLATMKPPRTLPPHRQEDPAGLYRLKIDLGPDESLHYVVQVPPEYDPNRKYPCVLALPGRGEPPELEIDWWCGLNIVPPTVDPTDTGTNPVAAVTDDQILSTDVDSAADGQSAATAGPDAADRPFANQEFRIGHATRYGYIVIAPAWMHDGQGSYQYTEAEHNRILKALRDGLRHFSVDTDRVFISGHFDGATAAWDLAQAHPELWAGAIMISPEADKHIVHYHDNMRASNASPDEIPLATYVVYGQADGTRFSSKLGTVGSRYLSSPAYDSLFVEYQGRGRERFLAELPRIIEWMEMSSHRRVRTPRQIETVTMRPGDRFFYWLEAPQILPKAAGNAFQFEPTGIAKFEANLLESALNGVRISTIPSLNRDAIVWLTPDMVDFTRPVTIILRGDRSRHDLAPDIGIMLEDARTRADLMHVFWQRVSVP